MESMELHPPIAENSPPPWEVEGFKAASKSGAAEQPAARPVGTAMERYGPGQHPTQVPK